MASSASTPLGYRFCPTDQELVGHYLEHKLRGNHSEVNNVITEIDICRYEPWKLPELSKVKSNDPEWFFFSPVDLKLTKDTRNWCNRQTEAGFWKPTGKDRKIKSRGTNNVIGTKKTLVFYRGRCKHAEKTSYVIHEYHAATFSKDKGGFVLCRLMYKDDKKAEKGTDTLMHDAGEPCSQIAADLESQEMENEIQRLRNFPKEVNMDSIFATPPQTQEPSSQVSSFPNANFGKEKGKAVLLPRDQLKYDSPTTYVGMSPRKRARGDGESSNVEVNSNSVNSLAENRPLKEERLDFSNMLCHLTELKLLVSTLAKELAEVEDMEKNLVDVCSQIRSAAANIEKLIAVKDEENKTLVSLKRDCKVGLDLESEWPPRKAEVADIQESAFWNHVHGFASALAQVMLIYPDIDLSGVNVFNDTVNGMRANEEDLELI